MQINSYESEKAKGLRIWDTRGFETLKYNYKDHYKDISSKIKELIKNKILMNIFIVFGFAYFLLI